MLVTSDLQLGGYAKYVLHLDTIGIRYCLLHIGKLSPAAKSQSFNHWRSCPYHPRSPHICLTPAIQCTAGGINLPINAVHCMRFDGINPTSKYGLKCMKPTDTQF